jgi:signal transduction histidine kinase
MLHKLKNFINRKLKIPAPLKYLPNTIRFIKQQETVFTNQAATKEPEQTVEALEQERILLTQHLHKCITELATTKADLIRASQFQDDFLANMSHELRTPLNTVLGVAEVLQEGVYGTLSPQQLKSIQMAEKSGRHLLSLINNILELAKIDAGKFKLNRKLVSAEKMADICLHLIKNSALQKSITISARFDTEKMFIHADEYYFKQMLFHLLNNAVKFTPEKGTIGLEIRNDTKRRMVSFIVSDTGIGIAKEDLNSLFKPFMQLDSGLNRAYEGIGLGLTLVSRLAKMHSGSISIESELGKGSRFILSLPWRSEDDPLLQDAQLHSNLLSPAVILLVDDSSIVTETLSDYLNTKGYQVITATDGLQAFKKAKEIHPDLIVMDIKMPKMNGLDVTRKIRSNGSLADIPIIALTVLTMPGDRELCLEAGANEYLSKPVQFKQLISTIKKFV